MSDTREALLTVSHLCQYFKNKKETIRAVDDVSFTIHKGEVFGLVGESGCGKTTTGRSIIGLYDITSGEVYFKGEKISDKKHRDPAKIARQIQMIYQDPVASLDPRMTVYETIAEGLIIQGEKDKAVIDRKVYEMLELIGLVKEHADRYPHEFSGGQRQRIGIARAVVMMPELLIADEPVSALDVSIQAQVINLLNDLREKFSLTVLFIAHDLSVVKYFSDRIAVMYFGKMVELADADELFAHPLHPYTKALLSAIPIPDPFIEKGRKRIIYQPGQEKEDPSAPQTFREIAPGHFVRCNDAEERAMKEALGIA